MHDVPFYVNAITLMCCMISAFSSTMIATGFWKTKISPYICAASSALVIGTIAWLSIRFENEIAAYLLLLAIELLFIKSVAHITWSATFLVGTTSIFYTICLKGVVIGIFSLLLQKNLYKIITHPSLSVWVMTITMILKAVVLCSYRNESSKRKLRVLLNSQTELVTVLMQHGALFIFMLFFSYNYYYNLDLVWFSFAQMLLSALMLVLHNLILYYGSRVSYLLENEAHLALIQRQLNSQIAHYHSYEDLFKQLDSFKHRIKETSITIQQLIHDREYIEAEELINNTLPCLVNQLPTKKVFSNSKLVNAFMLDWHHDCLVKGIVLDGLLHVPQALLSKEIDIVHLLAEIREIYMLLSHSTENTVIKIMSKNAQNRLILYSSGPYRGIIEDKDDLPHFSTLHAVEIKSCYYTLMNRNDALNGTLYWDASKNPELFKLTLSIHL